MTNELSFKPLGEHTLLIEWPDEISIKILKQISALEHAIINNPIQGVIETFPAYRSLAVDFEPDDITITQLIESIKTINNATESNILKSNKWKIPVCYEKPFSPDLEAVADQLKLKPDEVINIHSSGAYLVHFMGFLPGFMYLGGLDKKLHLARKSSPNLKVPKGAVAIGGAQTGIYPQESPGGWHIIGNSPLHFFDVKSENPCFVAPGDIVQFDPISYQEFKVIELESKLDVFDLDSICIHG